MAAEETAKVPAGIKVNCLEIVRSESLKVLGTVFGQGITASLLEPVVLKTVAKNANLFYNLRWQEVRCKNVGNFDIISSRHRCHCC